MPVLKPPAPLDWRPDQFSVFLAGSIDNGAAPDWQAEAEAALVFFDPVVVNPRRDNWDPRATSEMQKEQIRWELDALAVVDMIAMYLAPGSMAPITLLELGLFCDRERLVVCCPEGYWRRDNVLEVCSRFAIPMVADLRALTGVILQRLHKHQASLAVDRLGEFSNAKGAKRWVLE